ncbi:MAG: hypothetical protein COB54_07905 [Alphaproteobacteria bacterium]|nr:MAG: hypothetical protein COB54_07905 [Alphaproteobacteria bacterium]
MPTSNPLENTPPPTIFNLGQLLDDVALQITGDSIDIPSRFSFVWHNINFAGQVLLINDSQNQFSINLVANLGHIPFSAEDRAHRKKLLESFTPLFMKGDFRLAVNSQIQMVMLTNFTGPVNAKRIMEVITCTLLDLQTDLKSVQASISG